MTYKHKKQQNTKKLTLIFLTIILLTIISYFFFDKTIAILSQNTIQNTKIIYQIFNTITILGSIYIILPLIIISLYEFYILKSHHKKQRPYYFLFIGMSTTISWCTTFIIKITFGRYRPELFLKENLYGLTFFSLSDSSNSFPSGHTTTIFALMTSLTLLFPKYKWLFIPTAIIVATSRIILAKHYLSDVIFATFIGIFITYFLKQKYFSKNIHFPKLS